MQDKANPQIGSLSFDEWVELAENHPDQFQLRRLEEISQAIGNAPPHLQEKLKQLQFRIDGIRFKYRKNKFVCAQVLYEEMLASVSVLNDRLHELLNNLEPPSDSSSKSGLRSV